MITYINRNLFLFQVTISIFLYLTGSSVCSETESSKAKTVISVGYTISEKTKNQPESIKSISKPIQLGVDSQNESHPLDLDVKITKTTNINASNETKDDKSNIDNKKNDEPKRISVRKPRIRNERKEKFLVNNSRNRQRRPLTFFLNRQRKKSDNSDSDNTQRSTIRSTIRSTVRSRTRSRENRKSEEIKKVLNNSSHIIVSNKNSPPKNIVTNIKSSENLSKDDKTELKDLNRIVRSGNSTSRTPALSKSLENPVETEEEYQTSESAALPVRRKQTGKRRRIVDPELRRALRERRRKLGLPPRRKPRKQIDNDRVILYCIFII